MAGFWKTFSLGPLEHAGRLFVEPYTKAFLPVWAVWTVGTIVPVCC
jgi:hypothetical protein